jgi:hypothetical protein
VLEVPEICRNTEKGHAEKALRKKHSDFQRVKLATFQFRQYLSDASAQDLVPRPAYHSGFLAAAELQETPVGFPDFAAEHVIIEILNSSPTGHEIFCLSR